ncbi:Dyp-type peroxidase [Isoptericola croceus]|uniref:Dyp-type peroxidase n=1 Tax=Isoptericola croceus TaxID=3031406 RepID=UPI0023F70334|nr:Dyp-type peroxidase [Isoptericola croceus]
MNDDAGLDRRTLLRGLAGVGLGLGIGAGVGAGATSIALRPETPGAADTAAPGADTGSEAARPGGRRVEPHGPHQAGVTRPPTPQQHCLLAVFDAERTDQVADLCDTIGRAVDELLAGASGELPDGPGNLTVTVGIGPRLVGAVDPALPGADDLPAFVGDVGLPQGTTGGDLMIQLCASDPGVLEPALEHVTAQVVDLRPRWRQRGFRGPGEGFVVRNPLGFHDGIAVPRTEAEQAENVWIADGPLAGGSVCVVRRLRLDAAAFRGEPVDRQEEIVGRRRDGVPLSGGTVDDEVRLQAKAPDGQLLVPPRSHARAAHPSFTDSRLMLRRGYAFDNGTTSGRDGDPVPDAGLLFICFQADLRTFSATQHRLDEIDDLMQYVTPTASGTFLVLPGSRDGAGLGGALRAGA